MRRSAPTDRSSVVGLKKRENEGAESSKVICDGARMSDKKGQMYLDMVIFWKLKEAL